MGGNRSAAHQGGQKWVSSVAGQIKTGRQHGRVGENGSAAQQGAEMGQQCGRAGKNRSEAWQSG